jgi:hypothetical protein
MIYMIVLSDRHRQKESYAHTDDVAKEAIDQTAADKAAADKAAADQQHRIKRRRSAASR